VVALHAHVPVVVSQAPFGQEAQAAPAAPHSPADCAEYGTHVLPLQQPFGQDVASQTHCPVVVLHSWPVAHAAQLAPAAPHDPPFSDAYGTHVLPLQHPFGHDVASHTQRPPLHSWPTAHAMQTAPAAPQDAVDSPESGSHVPALQHPVHDVPPHEHAPLEQVSLALQVPQLPPPVPHALADCET
jgi:hypothetical protein